MLEYILVALIAWTHQSAETLKPWASAMADVCTSRQECVALASQAFVETRFAPEALDGRCNDRAWRAQQTSWWHGACDGGVAQGAWQIHDDRLRGASPEMQASVALEIMRRTPRAWTTWRAARSQAAWWLASHP